MANDTKPSACIVMFGIRFLSADYIDTDTDPRALLAEKHNLSAWPGRRYPPPEKGEPGHFLLIGARVCRVAFDGSCEDSATLAEVQKTIKTVTARLAKAGFTDAPALWVQCKYD